MNSYDVYLFGLEFKLKPVAFTIPLGSKSWDVYWYGIIIALGFLLALIYGMKNAKRLNIDTDRMLDVALVTTPLAILCARLYYVIFDGIRLEGIGDFFGFGNSSGFSGLAIYGGVIGAFVIGGIMCKLRKIKILDMFDLAAIGFLIGQGIGRWGNFVNQEAYGDFTGSSWWGMESTRTIREMGEGLVHPCFLYESIWCLLGFFVLHKISKKRKFSGEITLFYGVWYGFGRAIIELLRTDSLMIGAIRVSCLLSVLLCLASAGLILYFRSRYNETVHDDEYVEMFYGGDSEEEENKDSLETEKSEEVLNDDIGEEIGDV